jgi:glutamine---fructose-6-phosphate transaminase (isomerizing)
MSEPFVPELRSGRPWVMEEMIASQPHLVEAMDRPEVRAAAAAVAEAVVAAVQAGQPVIVSGCGTSEHGAMAVAVQLRMALRQSGRSVLAVQSRQAFEAWLEPQADGLHLAISHEGGTAATNAAMASAAKAGAKVMAITAKPESPAARLAEATVVTPQHDRSWCHTVGYLSPILAGALVAQEITGQRAPLKGLASLTRALLGLSATAEEVGGPLAKSANLLVVGSGLDEIAACELALKIREGARMHATAYPLETILHGHLVAAQGNDGLIVILVEPTAREPRLARARQVLMAAREIGMMTAVLAVEDAAPALVAGDLATAGSLALPVVESPAEVLVASALGLQLLTIGLAAARGTNPDRIRREEGAYARAAEVVESGGLAGSGPARD